MKELTTISVTKLSGGKIIQSVLELGKNWEGPNDEGGFTQVISVPGIKSSDQLGKVFLSKYHSDENLLNAFSNILEVYAGDNKVTLHSGDIINIRLPIALRLIDPVE